MSANRGLNQALDAQMSANYVDEENKDDDKVHKDRYWEALTKLVCVKDLMPQVVECPHFQTFAIGLNPLAQLPCIETLIGNCLKFYEEERLRIKQILRNLDSQISLSVEIFTSSHGTPKEYMCLRAHFLDNNWESKKWVLEFHVLDGNVFSETIQKSLLYWDIGDKISTIALETNNYIEETAQIVGDHVQKKKKLQLNGQLFHVYCCADFFNLMAQDAFDDIATTIDRVDQLFSMPYITTSRLKGALELQSIGEFSSCCVENGYELPAADEWKKVEEIRKLVELIHNSAHLSVETKYPTASIILGNLLELQISLTREASSSESYINAVVKKLLQRLDKYWKDMFLVLTFITIMDPRCKMKFINYLSSKIGGGNDNSQVLTIMEAIHTLYDDYPTRNPEMEDYTTDEESSDEEGEEEEDLDSEIERPQKEKRKAEETPRKKDECRDSNGGSKQLEEYNQFLQSTIRPSKSELDWYLEEPVLPWSPDFNLLNWWRAASPKFPTLSRMARDILSVPLSLRTSSAYNTKERKVVPELMSSGQDVINALMCTRSWHHKS